LTDKCEIKTVLAKVVTNKTTEASCPDCNDTGLYVVQNVYTGSHEVPCEFCEKGLEIVKQLFPELNNEVIRHNIANN
jgi:hypothetical protein